MKINGVIAEFNPFHNGHKYLLDTVRENPEDGVVCVMSGNFVQRGEPAIISKFARTKAAIACGADLVLELPLPYSISSAMYFANGATEILNGLGVVDTLCFGSECGDVEKIKHAAGIMNNPLMSELTKTELKTGVSYPVARKEAAEKLSFEDDLSVLTTPNDILAVEYISAAQRIGAKFDFKAIKRIGTDHDSDTVNGQYCSASHIRELIKTNPALLKGFMPDESFNILIEEAKQGKLASYSLLERAVVAHLRTVTPESLRNVPDVSEGIENRIILASNKFNTLDEIISASKSKRYTHARLRRIVLASYLGLAGGFRQRKVPYIRVLGLNEKGAEILSLAKHKSTLFVVGSLKEAERISSTAARYAELEAKAGDIYSLMQKYPSPGKTDYTTKFYKNF